MSYNGQTFTYDTLGNPTTYKGVNLTWSRGRQLVSYGDKASYTYNVSGIRTSKQVGNTTTNYFLDGTRIIAQVDTVTGVDDTTVTTTTEYIYGVDGITGFVLEGIPYYYKKNLQGDIIAILDKDLQIVTKYAYDAWGNCKTFYLNNGNFVDIDSTISYTENNAENAETVDYRYIAIKNPFRYRGYYYDVESNLYYLNSRYYDPELGRFITIDDISVISDSKDLFNGLNLYVYCGDNPVSFIDSTGYSWESFWNSVGNWFQDNFVKIIVGSVLIITGAVVTFFTAGMGTAGLLAAGSALLASIKAVGISMAVSAGIGAVVGGITGGWEGVLQGFGNGLADGFMWGGVFAGSAQILSGAFKIAAQMGAKTGRKGGIQLMKNLKILSPNNKNFYENGGTLLKIGKNLRFDVGAQTLLHMHLFKFNHIPLGTIISSLIGGLNSIW